MTHELTSAELAALTAQLQPTIMDGLARATNPHYAPVEVTQALIAGGKIPPGYEVTRDGRVQKASTTAGFALRSAALLGGGLLGGAALGSLGGAASATAPAVASAGGGVGIGETAATFGLPASLAPAAAHAGASASPWLTGALSSAPTLLGSAIGSRAANKAASTQADASKEAARRNDAAMAQALGLIQGQQAQTQAAYSPYASMGTTALSSLGNLINMPAQQSSPSASPFALSAPAPPLSVGAGQTPAAAAAAPPVVLPPGGQSTPTVRLMAPSGAVRDVPADQAEHYIARGARKVN